MTEEVGGSQIVEHCDEGGQGQCRGRGKSEEKSVGKKYDILNLGDALLHIDSR